MKNKRSKAVIGVSLILVILVILISKDFWRQTQSTEKIGRIISRTESSVASRRVKAFEELEDILSPTSELTYSGFSDTPIETELKVKQIKELSDEDIGRIALAIQRGLVDDNPVVREAAARAISSRSTPHPELMKALIIGLNGDDPTVVWYVAQVAQKYLPPVNEVIDSLIDKLDDDDFSGSWMMFDLMETYGVQVKPYEDRILDAILNSKSGRVSKLYILYKLKVEIQSAEKLVDASNKFNRDELAIAALSILEYPQLLKRMESIRPETAEALQDQLPRLSTFMCKHYGTGHETLSWLAKSDQLLPTTMALLGEKRFIPEIEQKEKTASEHRRTFLAACKRACGAPVGEQLIVDADHPVEFRPKSAWPETDDRRMSSTSSGHGDGFVEVMLTGEIRGDDGTHPAEIQFFRTNDSMLLGSEQNYPEDLIYQPDTGRFVFYTTVFAAYSRGNDQEEPGPYQTGSSQIRIEADGFEPLSVQFFDEMPDVLITLTAR